MKGFGDLYKSEKKKIKKPKFSQEQIINQAIHLHLKGNISEAAKSYQYFIDKGYKDCRVFSNYGVILQGQGKLKDAELAYRKAIELKPDYAEAHTNLGNILRYQGKLKDAELAYRNAIELRPDYAVIYLNLGSIFIDLGRFEEAETYHRKAIELKPDYAEAHNNLGNILVNLAKLKDAELAYRKAIELKPDYELAHHNLGNNLRDLGNLQEVMLLSKSILKSRRLNQGYKLLASLRMIIINLLSKNFAETQLYINKTNDLLNQESINNIENESDKKYFFSYFGFIDSLYSLLEKENKSSFSRIPHFGESHCLSFAHQSLYISSELNQIQPVLVTGAKAWHFANNQSNKWKDSFTQQIKNHTYSDKVFVSFGEIDCRKDEGILNYSIKKNKDISEVCEKTIKGYLDYMEQNLSSNYSNRYYFGVPAPTRKGKILDELDFKRIKIIKLYNSILKKEVLSRGSYFLDVYTMTSTKDGENNKLYMCDKTHLSPKCLSILFKNYFHES